MIQPFKTYETTKLGLINKSNAVNEKANQQGNGDVKCLMQTLKETDRMPTFPYLKALCLSSLLLSDFCTSVLLILSHTISYMFHKLFQLYDKGHNGFTHSVY